MDPSSPAARPTSRLRRGCALSLVLLLVLVPVAGAQSPFDSLPQSQSQTQTVQTTQTSAGDSTLGTSEVVLIVAGAVVLLGAIGLFIARDARRRAPVDERELAAIREDPSTHRRSEQAKRQQRAKQKAARAQRRRNR